MQHRQALEQTPDGIASRAAEIPFGIRAIQSGIQVDGVWISGSNTPNQSAPTSRAPSVMLDTDSKKSHSPERPAAAPTNSRVERPQPTLRQSSQGRPATASRSSAFPHGPSYQMERPSNRLSADYIPRGRPSYQPRRASGLRYSNIDENSDALDALEGRRNGTIAGADVSQGMPNFISRIRQNQPEPQRAEFHELVLMPPKPGYLSREHSSGSSNASSGGEEPLRAPRRPPVVRGPSRTLYDPAYPSRNATQDINAHQRSSFDALAHHRRSQGAEEGQLLPRIRPNQASDSTTSNAAEHGSSFEEPRGAEEARDPFGTPLGTPMGSPIRDLEEPPSFANFVNSNPPPDNHMRTLEDPEEAFLSSHHDSTPLQHSDGNRQRHSQIAQNVNSRFKIPQPGSFSQPQNGYVGGWNRDLERAGGEGFDTTGLNGGPKKLQRKRADSKESRFKEQV